MHHQPMSSPNGPVERQLSEARRSFETRSAPIIRTNPMKEVYNADRPTAGQPYAFPDPEVHHSSGSNDDPRRASRADPSRRNSDHTSVTSSIYTTESRPPGSHRTIDGGMPCVYNDRSGGKGRTDRVQIRFRARIITRCNIDKSAN